MTEKRKRAKRPRPGQPPFEPTADQRRNVEAMIGFGIREDDICRLIINPYNGKPITGKTLRKHFRDEIRTGQVKANAAVLQSLFKSATGGNVGAIALYLKNRMGWRSEPKDDTSKDKDVTVVVKGGLPDDDD